MDLIVGTGKVADDLPVALALGEPAVTLEAEGLITRVVLHVDVAQVPARKHPCGRHWGDLELTVLLPSTFRFPLPSPPAMLPGTISLSFLDLGFLVDEMRDWVR